MYRPDIDPNMSMAFGNIDAEARRRLRISPPNSDQSDRQDATYHRVGRLSNAHRSEIPTLITGTIVYFGTGGTACVDFASLGFGAVIEGDFDFGPSIATLVGGGRTNGMCAYAACGAENSAS